MSKKHAGPVIAKKPDNLVYGLDDKPPLSVTLMLGMQHVVITFIGILFPVMIVQKLGDSIPAATGQALISMSLIAGGLVTIVQARRIGIYGSGYFCPSVSGPSYLHASLQSISIGGLPLMFGMTFFVGLVESSLAPLIKRMRFLFPAEVTGLVVALVGITVIPLTVKDLLGYEVIDGVEYMSMKACFTGLFTLFLMIGLNIYGRGKVKLFATLIGIMAGYVLSSVLGVTQASDWQTVNDANWFTIPSVTHLRWSFDPTLIIPFSVAALCSTLKSVGDMATCQKINDAKWVRPEMNNISHGIFADSLGGLVSGAIGGFGQSTSSSNIGMSIATSSTSRVIAYAMGGILFFLAFFPKLAQVFVIIPPPVLGATLIFAVSFMIVTGFQLMMSRMLDSRKTFVIGVSLILGLSADMLPQVYDDFHPWLAPIFSSSLALGTVSAVLLNLLCRLGVKKKVKFTVTPGLDAPDQIHAQMKKHGGSWGARHEIVDSVISALTELADLLVVEKHIHDNNMNITASFDEFNIKLTIDYAGTVPELPANAPDIKGLMDGECTISSLTGYLVSQQVDEISLEQKGNRGYITMRWDH